MLVDEVLVVVDDEDWLDEVIDEVVDEVVDNIVVTGPVIVCALEFSVGASLPLTVLLALLLIVTVVARWLEALADELVVSTSHRFSSELSPAAHEQDRKLYVQYNTANRLRRNVLQDES